MNRREFLAATAGAIVPAHLLAQVEALGPEEVASPTTRGSGPILRVAAREADGGIMELERYRTCHARDLANDPLPQAIHSDHRVAQIALPKEPIQISYRLKVPDFGEVYCYADNNGRGYSAPQQIDFISEAATTRLRRVREILALAQQEGAPLADEINRHLEAAAHTTGYASLAQSLHAGEKISLARARHRISRLAAPRKDFLFGCMISPFESQGAAFEQRVRELFNFATVCWYTWKNEQPPEARIDYGRMDRSIDWCLQRHIMPKSFGYVYLTKGATPEWLRNWSYEQLLAEYPRIVAQTMRRYGDRLPYAEIMNEAHDKANLWKLSHAQIIELAKRSFAAAREASPKVKRQMNHCCLWAEYAKNTNADGSRRWSPWRFIKDCLASGVDYDVIGLQLYYPQQDLLEIERMLDRFAVFNKPLHITEIATASEPGADPHSMRPTTTAPGWHGPWSESTQADWLESTYTLCYSKPQFQAIGWWDLADIGGHFWPHGGLLHGDLSPKEGYHRLAQLQKSWGVARA